MGEEMDFGEERTQWLRVRIGGGEYDELLQRAIDLLNREIQKYRKGEQPERYERLTCEVWLTGGEPRVE